LRNKKGLWSGERKNTTEGKEQRGKPPSTLEGS